MHFSLKELQKLSILKNLPDELLSWLTNHGSRLDLSADEYMFEHDQIASFMFIIVSGQIQRYERIGQQWVVADIYSSGQVTGMLPFSRMTHYPGPAVAKEDSQVLRIDKKDFPEMLSLSEEFGQRLIAEMSNRVRGGVRMEQQIQKMASLGQLASGLAHEINNPASAISRTAKTVKEIFNKQSLNIFKNYSTINEADKRAIKDFLFADNKKKNLKLTPLRRSELEEQLSTFFDNKSVNDSSNLSQIFVESGFFLSDVESFSKRFSAQVFAEIITLMATHIEINNLLSEITKSASGISELVSSIKSYSHMDQASGYKAVEVCATMDSTLKILDHKLKQKKIKVTKHYQEDIPFIQGNAGQLSQVWTHLIDNAIDAVEMAGQINIEIKSHSLGIEVKIGDNGKGIPEEIRDKIFDAFFTTKDLGQGTGLGLEISRKIIHAHGGHIESRHQKGQTEMLVLLPL